MFEKYTINNNLYLIGVSGGPDSMALLHMLYKNRLNLIVCHVNYHTRKESDQEKDMVERYSKLYNYPFYYLDAFFNGKGNFESWAREKRYCFFKEVAHKYNAKGLFIAHHEDDLLETYIMQKRRKGFVKKWGFNEKTTIFDMDVYRPLVRFSKKDLLNYCIENNIKYSIDSTNFERINTRNKIRLDVISMMSKEERENMLEEINLKNIELDKNMNYIARLLKKEKYYVNEVMNLTEEQRHLFFYEIITRECPSLVKKITWTKIHEIERILTSSKPNLFYNLTKTRMIVKEYDIFFLSDKVKPMNYAYTLLEPSSLDNEIFSCDFRIDTAFLKIYESSYPLVIRNAKKDDVVTIGNVTKKINRVFIDAKIPMNNRINYPVVVNNRGKVVYIPLYNNDIQKSIANKLKFVIK